MRRLVVLLTLAVVLVLPGLPGAPSAGAAARACPTGWGSTAEEAGPALSPAKRITNVRTGRHACFDRFVVDLNGSAAGYHVRYVRRYRAEGSGNVIPLPGGARLEIIVRASTRRTYRPTVGQSLPGVDVGGYQTFRSTRFGGSFEGQTSFGLGVRARLPFRVLKLGNRVVVDVAHRW